MENIPDRYLYPLIEVAKTATRVRSSKHAACLVYKNKMLASGRNSLKTHPIMNTYGRNPDAIYLHAEIDAIVRTINLHGSDILSECTMYVIRINKKGEIASSCPCEGCQRAIKAFNIRHVVWS